jgi:formate dehydrogenase iron-sulfur subunit
LETACAKACPTGSIAFGDVQTLMTGARQRLAALQSQGYPQAQLYGESSMLGGLNVFYLLLAEPGVYGLPQNPQLPERNLVTNTLVSAGTAVVLGISALIAFRQRGKAPVEAEPSGKGEV